MTETEKKKLMEGFMETDKKTVTDPWTDEEIIRVAEKQLRKLKVLNENERLR